jgi:hypothetical protein
MEGVDSISYSRWDEVDSAVRLPMSLQVGVRGNTSKDDDVTHTGRGNVI